MDPAEYDKLDRLEDRMWWFAATHANLIMLAHRFGASAAPRRILDAGCGTGGLLAKLAAAVGASMVIGLDADESAGDRARAKSARPVCRGSVNALPFRDAAFSAYFSADGGARPGCYRGRTICPAGRLALPVWRVAGGGRRQAGRELRSLMSDSIRDPAAPASPRFALSIVTPVANGAASIGELVATLEELQIPCGHEIVLVNDASPDNSLAVCRALVERARIPITLVDLARNYGEHNAVMAGLHHASGVHVITMDDDLQNPPEEVERLLEYAQNTGHEVVYTFYDEKQHAFWRNLGSRFTNWVAGFVLDKPKGFYLSSFRCMSAFVVRE